MTGHDLRPPSPPGPDDLPLAFLVDYDGTIALTDVSDAIMAEHVPGAWEEIVARYDAGDLGSRRLMDWEMSLVDADPAALLATAAAQPHDPGFAGFTARALAAGALVEVVSDGFGFFIGPALDRLGLPDVPIATAETTFRGTRPTIRFPNGHPSCFVCGTCKRSRVLAHQAAGRAAVFVGDGESDRYAAGYADVVFAKRSLIAICRRNGWPFESWSGFADVEAWTAEIDGAWRADRDTPRLPRPRARPFFCGPEAWGDGRWDPPTGA